MNHRSPYFRNNLHALVVLNTPQLQKRAMVAAACSGVRRPCLIQSINLRTSPKDTIPWPHIVESSRVFRSAMRSV